MEQRGTPHIEAGDLTVDERDVAALDAIDAEGSMHAAAAELGRSYSRLQNRVVELEAEFGPLVERQRGGEGGGGSTLTRQARDLLDTFERLRVEVSGLADAEESVFTGRVVDRDGTLATVETGAGTLTAVLSEPADEVQVSVRSDTVVLTDPAEGPEPDDTSARNRFSGTVTDVESDESLGRVTVDVGSETPLRALVTRDSLDRLALDAGEEIVASFKATATRAVPE